MAKSTRGTKPSFDEINAKLESGKKALIKGQRNILYQSLQLSAEVALSAESDETIESRFRTKLGEKDVLRGVLIYMFDAKSEPEMKKVSKRALALRYLIENAKVSVEDIATAIPKHGGIEKLARLAAKPRVDQGGDEVENEKPKSNLGRQIHVGFSPRLSKKLDGFVDNTRVKIIGYVRMYSDEPLTIEATKIEFAPRKKIAKSKAKKPSKKETESEHDWA